MSRENYEHVLGELLALVKEKAREDNLRQEWYDLETACQLKGICAKTARNQPWLQPNGGVPDGIVGKRKRWRRETIREWLPLTDEELAS